MKIYFISKHMFFSKTHYLILNRSVMINISKETSKRLQKMQATLNGNCQMMQGHTMTNLTQQSSLNKMEHTLLKRESSF